MTDQPKWTPGPWAMETVRTSCGTCHRIGPFPRPAYASKPEGWACVYDDYPPGVGSPDLLANSRLIAAAPDLARALLDARAELAQARAEAQAAVARGMELAAEILAVRADVLLVDAGADAELVRVLDASVAAIRTAATSLRTGEAG